MTNTSPQRRTVQYRGYEMILTDAECLAAGEHETVGNWSFGQILDHLTKSFTASIDGTGAKLPWVMRIIGGFFLKGRMLNQTLPAGFNIPKDSQSKFTPTDEISTDEALTAFRHVIHRCKTEKTRSFHPLFGNLPTPEWDRFNLRHAELHMSFVLPVESDIPADHTEVAAST